jgi:hypothetical protein
VTVNNKVVSKDTKQNLVLAPAAFWEHFLQPKLEKLLRRKVPHNRCVKPDDTNIVISVTERSERDLTKRLDDTNIDWSIIEKQLVDWGELFRAGKKLRVDITFSYIEAAPEPVGLKKRDKRGRSSATQQMLSEWADFLDTDDESPSVWRDIYSLMRCPGPPCHLGPHCWRDPVSKKHYKLNTHHFRRLIRHAEQGHPIRTHDDVPEDIRDELYAEEHQRLERRQVASKSSPSMAPINITNILPGNSPQASVPTSYTRSPLSMQLSDSLLADHLDIPGLRDTAVREYSEWQQSRVGDEMLKNEFQKACDAILIEGLDLEHEDQDAEFLVRSGVKRGIARRFVRDIGHWGKRHKLDTELRWCCITFDRFIITECCMSDCGRLPFSISP